MMMVIDPNVSQFIVILSKTVKVNIERFYWMIRFHPFIYSSKIGKWWMMRKYMKTVKELSKEMGQEQK
jgi:hypothetical protein